ncbi:MAG: hypothetical protein V3T09_00790 [bacterium]
MSATDSVSPKPIVVSLTESILFLISHNLTVSARAKDNIRFSESEPIEFV